MSRRTALALLPLLALFTAPLRADVIVVDPHGGSGAALLQSALDGAQPGDLVLLREGDYSAPAPIELSKGLTLIADSGAQIELPSVRFVEVPGGQRVLVRNLHFKAVPHANALDVLTLDFPRSVTLWVESCELQGLDGSVSPDGSAFWGSAGISASNLSSVTLEHCQLRGGRGADAATGPAGGPTPATPGGAGANFNSCASVALGALSATGGRGGDGAPDAFNPANGGAGVRASSGGTAFAIQGGQVVGGDEGETNPAATKPGSGLQLIGPWYTSVRDASIVAGAVHGDGTPVPPIEVIFWSPPAIYPAPARVLALDSPVRESGHCGVHVTGQPGDVAWMFLGSAPGGVYLPGKQGLFSLDAALPVLPVLLGPVDATGALDVDSVMPALPVGVDHALFFAQLAVDHGGKLLLGTASSLVWLSAAY